MATTLTRVDSQHDYMDHQDLADAARARSGPHQEPAGEFEPGNNLIETWDSYVVQIALPGIDLASLRLEMVARRLIARGTYRVPVIENGAFVWHGIPSGDFSEVFELPAAVDVDKSEARYDRGILTISLPKVAYLKPRVIHLLAEQ